MRRRLQSVPLDLDGPHRAKGNPVARALARHLVITIVGATLTYALVSWLVRR